MFSKLFKLAAFVFPFLQHLFHKNALFIQLVHSVTADLHSFGLVSSQGAIERIQADASTHVFAMSITY